jgi:hypothetical protein
MLQKEISPKTTMDLTDASLEHRLQRAPAGTDSINREWLGLRELTYYASVSE